MNANVEKTNFRKQSLINEEILFELSIVLYITLGTQH